jgi:Flp pilus assembly protein TadG
MRIKVKLFALIRSQSGVAAIEMGLLTPVILIGFLLMTDVGIAVAERMDLDRNVRAGVQAVMALTNDPKDVKDLVLASTNGTPNVSVAVSKTCACGNSAAPCNSLCSADEPPSVFLNISASKPYTGLILPTFNVGSQTHVQLR